MDKINIYIFFYIILFFFFKWALLIKHILFIKIFYKYKNNWIK